MSLGERVSDWLAAVLSSWAFILTQSILIIIWMVINTTTLGLGLAWDIYPFILLNLTLSLQAAYAGPLILMSQRRVEARDRSFVHQEFKAARSFEEQAKELLASLEDASIVMNERLHSLDLLVRQLQVLLELQEAQESGRDESS